MVSRILDTLGEYFEMVVSVCCVKSGLDAEMHHFHISPVLLELILKLSGPWKLYYSSLDTRWIALEKLYRLIYYM